MSSLENYLEVWEKLYLKIKSEKILIYRVNEMALYGESYLCLVPRNIKDVRNYLLKKYSDDNLGILLKDSNSTIQKFLEPLERENLTSENIQKLIDNGFSNIRTCKIPNLSKKNKNYPNSEKINKRSL